mgnify:FL=1|jgi:hypothetical protein|tara:strand:- start:888 stop:1412 length:525 start_codon:yes stop_codon:yes gene_type:complete
MKEIEIITKLATHQMICDGEADADELEIIQNLPSRMDQHIQEWGSAGVKITFTIRIGGSSKTSSNTDEDASISPQEICDIANQTIAELNELPDDESTTEYVNELASSIEDDDLKFHVLKMLVDISAADGDFDDNEIETLSDIAKIWSLEDDLADFMFMKTSEEWDWDKGNLKKL